MVDTLLDTYVNNMLQAANLQESENLKIATVYNSFYDGIKDALNQDNVSFETRKLIVSNFLAHYIDLEEIVTMAYRKNGSQSTANDIVARYASRLEKV